MTTLDHCQTTGVSIPTVSPVELVKALKELGTPPEALTVLRNWFDTHILEVGSEAIFDGVALAIQKIPENAILSQALSQNMPAVLNGIIRRGLFIQDPRVKGAPNGARAIRHSILIFKTADMVGPEEIELNKPKKSPLLVGL